MIRIVLQIHQRDLITTLRELFPDLYLDNLADGIATYIGTFGEGPERLRQQQFLYAQKIAYIDTTIEQQRNLLIRSFFQGVELEGNPITSISVRSILATLNYHSATLQTDSDYTVVFRFPPTWNPAMFRQENDHIGWLIVTEDISDGTSSYEAALIGPEQRPIETLKRTPTSEAMLTLARRGRLHSNTLYNPRPKRLRPL